MLLVFTKDCFINSILKEFQNNFDNLGGKKD